MKLNGFCLKALMYFFGIFPLTNKIVFSSFLGKRYSGNPKEIYEYLLKNQSIDANYIWLLDDDKYSENVKSVPYISIRALYHLSTAKIWVDDVRKWAWVRKRKNQFYIQTWHGAGPCLKKIELDATNMLDSYYVKSLQKDSRNANLFISECEWRTKNIKSAFNYSGEIIKCCPRIKVYEYKKNEIQKKIKNIFSIEDKSKILLYAPTFRDDGSTSAFDLDYHKILSTLEDRDKVEWYVIVRLHPSLMEKQNLVNYDKHIINGTDYDSFEELLVSSDAFISDYSGTLFQSVYLEKETYIYAKDYLEYTSNNRELYFSLEEIGIPIAQLNDELIEFIKDYNKEKEVIKQKMKEFNKRIGYYDNYPEYNQLIVEKICNELRGEKNDNRIHNRSL